MNFIKIYLRITLLIAFSIIHHDAIASLNYKQFDNIKLHGDASVVNCFKQDSIGVIWIGTNKGLYSFDGYNTHVYSNYKDQSYTQIYAFTLIGGILYMGTDNGVLVYNTKTDNYIPFSAHSPSDVRALLVDGNDLWIGSLNGLYRYSLKTKKIERIESGISHPTIYSIMKIDNGDIYVGTYNGLCRFNKKSNGFELVSLEPIMGRSNLFINSLLNDPIRKCIWIGAEGNLYKYDVATGLSHSIPEFRNNSIKSLALDADGNLVMGTDNGLFLYDGINNKHYIHDSRINSSLANNIVWSVYADNEHNMWIGTEYNISLARNDEYLRQIPISDLTSLGDGNRFHTIHKDKYGYLWLGGTNGLIRYDEKHNQSIWYSMGNDKYPLPHNRIRKIFGDKDDNLWIASDGSINMYDYAKEQFNNFKITNTSHTYNAKWAYGIAEDKKHNLWIGTCLGGVFVVNKADLIKSDQKIYIAQKNYSTNNGLGGNFVNQLITDNEGRMWLLLYKNGGLYKIDSITGTPIKIDIEKKLGEDPVYIINDNKGDIWCGIHGAVVKIDRDLNIGPPIKLGQFTKNDVLTMGNVDNKIWISTTDGMWELDIVSNKVRLLDIPNDEYTSIFYDKKENKIYLGGVDKLAVTSPEIVSIQDVSKPIYLTSIYVNDAPYKDQNKSIRFIDKFTFGHNENHIVMEFSDLQYSKIRRSRRVYKMEGVDKDWILLPENNNRVSYANLDYGTHKFEIKILDDEGNPTEQTKIIEIEIRSPWYYTAIAKLIYLILFLGLLAWIINFFRVRNRLKIERMNRDRTMEQVKSKMDFFTNISHEFKTPLSLIIAPVGKLISDNNDPKIAKGLRLIQENAIKLNTLIHSALEFKRIDITKDNLLIFSQIDIVDFCRHIFDTFAANYNDRSFVFNSTQQSIYIDVDVVKMESVVTNIVSNACKYTSPGALIAMSIELFDDNVEIKLSDSGVGIPANEMPYIFQRLYQSSRTKGNNAGTGIGLYLAKTYIQLHDGNISASSPEGGGSLFTISLPLRNASVSAGEKDVESQLDAFSKTILIVDDNHAITDFLKEVLSSEYKCLIAHNGKEGLTLCNSLTPDLMIIDVMMPLMDGLEMIKYVRNNPLLNGVPIILLTAKDDKYTEKESVKLGADTFMSKPFDIDMLLSRIKQLIESREKVRAKIRMEEITTVSQIEAESVDEKFIADVMRLIEENIGDSELNVNFVCDKLGCGSKQLYRKIKSHTGITPVEYIRQVRLKKAAMLLQQKKFTISEVMYMVGFSSSSYFSKCFVAQYGKSPRQFYEDNE